jgi:CheY-like chemotaxis protein
MFSTKDIEVASFVDPVQAIAEILRHPPQLIFLDYRLPKTSGDQVARVLGKNIPMVLVSGDINVESDFEFVAVITKPYKREEIQQIINKYLPAMNGPLQVE